METNEGDTPKIKDFNAKIPNKFNDLIGEPPLLEGENPEDF